MLIVVPRSTFQLHTSSISGTGILWNHNIEHKHGSNHVTEKSLNTIMAVVVTRVDTWES